MKSCNLLTCLWRSLWVCALVIMFSGLAQANNIRIFGKPVLADKDTINKTVMIKFDIAWDNSWKTSKPNNHDAAWIFVKCWDGEGWGPVYLEEDGGIPGSTDPAKAVNPGILYSVTNREGTETNHAMKLEPAYSYGWKGWKSTPTEEAVKCVVGYFLYRDTYGAGHIVVPGVGLKWNYGSQGFVNEDDLVVKVFALEMVYVPEGPFYLGGIGTPGRVRGSFTCYKADFGYPKFITSEDSIVLENSADTATLWAYENWINQSAEPKGLPKGFPKGFNAFYIMKYELTQEAYMEFLNTLNQGQQNTRTRTDLNTLSVYDYVTGPNSDEWRYRRIGIRIKRAAPMLVFGMDGNNNKKFDEVDTICEEVDAGGDCIGRTLIRNIDGQDVAMSWVSYEDLLAYAEFSGLRPMTEMEYEKACRGPRKPVADEFAWGNSIVRFWYARSKDCNEKYKAADFMTGTERPERFGNYNCGAYIGQECSPGPHYVGPIRVGCFADSTTIRAASGATYWGVMNMSDNVTEMCAQVTYPISRKFVGTHGSGYLDENGNAVNTDWWDIKTGGASWQYYILKGFTLWDTWYWDQDQLNNLNYQHCYTGMVSNRIEWANSNIPANSREASSGGCYMRGIRCVRTDKAER